MKLKKSIGIRSCCSDDGRNADGLWWWQWRHWKLREHWELKQQQCSVLVKQPRQQLKFRECKQRRDCEPEVGDNWKWYADKL